MRAVLFGGTTEGCLLSRALADRGVDVVVSVATEVGRDEQGVYPGVEVISGVLDADGVEELIADADICIDSTHPYAHEVTRLIAEAASRRGVRLLRLVRPESSYPPSAAVVSTYDEAVLALRGTSGAVLLTTGVKHLEAFLPLGPERLYPRILPTSEGVRLCLDLGIPRKNIIAMQGPFSRELNVALIKQFSITSLVAKDGGEVGGFQEKVKAALSLGVRLVIIGRPYEVGLTYEELWDECERLLS